MSTADMLMEKGRSEGLEKGLEKGRVEGRLEGELMGRIAAYERILQVDPTNPEKLASLTLADLRERMTRLETQLFR